MGLVHEQVPVQSAGGAGGGRVVRCVGGAAGAGDGLAAGYAHSDHPRWGGADLLAGPAAARPARVAAIAALHACARTCRRRPISP